MKCTAGSTSLGHLEGVSFLFFLAFYFFLYFFLAAVLTMTPGGMDGLVAASTAALATDCTLSRSWLAEIEEVDKSCHCL